ncbi:MAG: protein kinase [Verrucomicrobiaceae bacterium]|nr:protein kinase [Verrucomicrobiaceae bacterium]
MNAPVEAAMCPKCGSSLPDIDGLCAKCLARSALNQGTGWLSQSHATPSQSSELPQIDGWKIIGTLGAGGMGRVYQAESEADGSAAAIKVLDQRWSDDPAMEARFQNEARLLQQLDHPNIVRLIETTETNDGQLCLVTELVQGCDLARLLRAEKLSHQRALEIFDKVCSAVEHAHEHGLIHRDIKPSNILVGREGEVKLADFGLARAADEEGGVSIIGGLTATTDQFGTAYYLAPERMIGETHAEAAMDVYSLGVLLYHLLTGQMPLGNYQLVSALTGLPKQMDAIVAEALEADPAKRIQEAKDMHQRVMSLWRDFSEGTLRAKKIRRALALAAGVLLLAITAVAGAWWQQERMKPKPVVYPDPTAASVQAPFVNSLGMKFVPVPGTKVLFSVYETRRREAKAFVLAMEEKLEIPWLDNEFSRRMQAFNRSLWNYQSADGTWTNFSFDDPGWPVTPEHPVIFASAVDATNMCRWLTWKERQEGRLKPDQRYRLPTDAEWRKASGDIDKPVSPGNLAGPEAREGLWPKDMPTFETPDAYPRTAPVGSFPTELYGLHDMSGNVAEWVNDEPDLTWEQVPLRARHTLRARGPSYADGTPESAAFGYMRLVHPTKRVANTGFRMVLELAGPDPK